MAAREEDVEFPECCASCPHLQSFTASCGHDLQQSLRQELTDRNTCPVYTQAKTDAMQQLAESL